MSKIDSDIIFLSTAEEYQAKEAHVKISYLSFGDLRFAHIYDFYLGPLGLLSSCDAIVIEATEYESSIALISRIRSHFDQGLFLKPVFIYTNLLVPSGLLDQMIDGVLGNVHALESISGPANLINHRVIQFELSKKQTYEDQRIFNFMAFVASRDIREIVPFIDRRGIYYPVLSDTSKTQIQNKHFLVALERMEKDDYLRSSFYKSTYLCSNCLGDHLLYREVCPSCKSADLKSEEIIHHFRCAHVAPMSKFRPTAVVNAALECPKCQHQLKHIGVDYDKPATMHYCQNCQSEFQNYAMMAQCTDCGHDQEVEHLVKKELKKYSLTEKTHTALKAGHLHLEREVESGLEDTLPWHLFIKTIDFEQSRESGAINHLVMVELHDLPAMVKQVGLENKSKLLNEIIQIVKSTQQPFDFRGAKLPRLYFTLMQTKAQDAEIISQRIIFLINHLLQDNLRIKRSTVTSEVLSFDTELIQAMVLKDHSIS
jgi:transcription elongation factor Elf1